MVSLTDHDDIEAGMYLHPSDPRHIPVSLEWTIPFSPSYLHVGVHNIPAAEARQIMSALAAYTAAPQEARLAGLFEHLDRFPGTLVVLNHPLWEMEPIGERAVRDMVRTFLARYGRWVHALEVNGMRPWHENRLVLEMAQNLNFPVVSGGDRHGCEPNAMVNLTNAATFTEFVREVREGAPSEIATMPQYREPYNLRVMQVVWDVLRNDRNLNGEQRGWTSASFSTGGWSSQASLAMLEGRAHAIETDHGLHPGAGSPAFTRCPAGWRSRERKGMPNEPSTARRALYRLLSRGEWRCPHLPPPGAVCDGS